MTARGKNANAPTEYVTLARWGLGFDSYDMGKLLVTSTQTINEQPGRKFKAGNNANGMKNIQESHPMELDSEQKGASVKAFFKDISSFDALLATEKNTN